MQWPLRTCVATFIILFTTALLAVGTRPLRADDAALEARQRKQVGAALKKGKGDWYAVQLLRISYSNGGMRKFMQRKIVNRVPVMVESTEFTLKEVEIPTATFEVVEGLEPTIDKIVAHLGPPGAKPSKATKNRRSKLAEPSKDETSWVYLGRFKTREAAREEVDLAKQTFDSEPHWMVPEKDKDKAR